jgi:hypothetical protein
MIRYLQYTPDGEHLLSVSADRVLKIWNLKNGREGMSLPQAGTGQHLGPDGKVIGIRHDRTVSFYTAEEPGPVHSYTETARINAFTFTKDRLVLGIGGTITISDLETKREILSIKGHTGTIKAIAFSPDGRILATGSADHTILLRDSFPWRKNELPGSDELSSAERMELYKRQYWEQRIAHLTNR